MAKTIALIVYVPDKADLIRQFFGLYYSVMMHPVLRDNIDFIIGCEPGMPSLFEIENCIVSHTTDLSLDAQYQFRHMENEIYGYINSWSHFNDQHSIEILLEYEYALRVDVDTFISPALLDIELAQNEILTGMGGYIGGQETIDNILRVSQAMNRQHRGIHNIGSTWFTHTRQMVKLGQESLKCAQYLLQQEFHEHGEWPLWYAFVSTMYAGEIALNDSDLQIRQSDKFDAYSTVDTPISQVYSIHSWHTDEYFSKHRYAVGDYNDRATPTRIDNCRDYAFFCSRLSDINLQKTRNSPQSLTPEQAILTATSLLRQAIPKLPAQIIRKFRNR